MKNRAFLLTFLLLAVGASAEAATLRGRLVDGTRGGVGRADKLEILDAAAGMQPVGTLEDVRGSFVFENLPDAAAAHLLLQVDAAGVRYTHRIAELDSEQEFEFAVYERVDSLEGVELSRHHVLFQRDPEHVLVTELLEFDNRTDPPRAIDAKALPMRAHVPQRDVHGGVEASVGSSTMPVQVALVGTGVDEVLAVERALLPGTTRMILRYQLHYPDDRVDWSVRTVYPERERKLFVAPESIEVTAPQMIREDSIYEGFVAWAGLPAEPGTEWKVALAGGTTIGGAPSASDGHGDHVTKVQVRPNRLSDNGILLMLGIGALLVLGLVLGLSRHPAPRLVRGAANVDERRAKISRLADRFISGEIDRAQFEKERDRILGRKGHDAETTVVS